MKLTLSIFVIQQGDRGSTDEGGSTQHMHAEEASLQLLGHRDEETGMWVEFPPHTFPYCKQQKGGRGLGTWLHNG